MSKELQIYKNIYKTKVLLHTDLHTGSPACNEDSILDHIDYVRRNKNCRIIGLGDWMDACLKSSVGNIYQQKLSPDKQIDLLYDWYKPVRRKIDGILSGNHEYRIEKETNINPMKILAKYLDVPYLGYNAIMKYIIGLRKKQEYIFYLTHGASGSTTVGGKLNAVMKLKNIVDADVYCMGHVHELLSFAQPNLKVIDNKVTQRKRYFVIGGHFLNYENSYAEKKGYSIGKQGVARITLHDKRWDVHTSI